MVEKQLAGLERQAVDGSESVHVGHELVGSVEVDPVERTAGERWEAEAEDGADISLKLEQANQPNFKYSFQIEGLIVSSSK